MAQIYTRTIRSYSWSQFCTWSHFLYARIVEKHFTDDNSRNGPDHSFSMNPESWRLMVENARELESSLEIYEKKVEDNEKETVVVQRRSIRLKFSKDR